MGLFSRKKSDVLSPQVAEASRVGDERARRFIEALPKSMEPRPTEGVFSNDAAAWEVRVRASRELRKFREDVLDVQTSCPGPGSQVPDWQRKFVSAFGEALCSLDQDAWNSSELRLQVEQGFQPSPEYLTNLIRPGVGRALGGIGLADIHERRVHKVADRMLIGNLILGYVEACWPHQSDTNLAYGFGWTFSRWIEWSDSSGLVVTV